MRASAAGRDGSARERPWSFRLVSPGFRDEACEYFTLEVLVLWSVGLLRLVSHLPRDVLAFVPDSPLRCRVASGI